MDFHNNKRSPDQEGGKFPIMTSEKKVKVWLTSITRWPVYQGNAMTASRSSYRSQAPDFFDRGPQDIEIDQNIE